MDAPTLIALHRSNRWRVHDLASDFRLLDVWRVPIRAAPGRDSLPQPIPGETRASVADRLTDEDVAANRIASIVVPPQPVALHPIYLFDEEALVEITNRTIHALLHLSFVPADERTKDVAMAVYIKSRGVLSDLYVAMIGPFRHWIVYPALIQQLETQWGRSGQ